MKTILFQGDSITDAIRDRENDNYLGSGYATMAAGQLGMEHPGEYRFLNRGISGNRVSDLYARIKRDIINLKPDYMSILIGVNDVWHEISSQNGLSRQKFEIIYDLLISELLEELPQLKIMILEPFVLPGTATEAIPERPDRWDTFRAEVPLRAAATKRIAQKYGLVYVPLQSCFDEACKTAPASDWLIDGVHPTAMGHELIKRQWLKGFTELTNEKGEV